MNNPMSVYVDGSLSFTFPIEYSPDGGAPRIYDVTVENVVRKCSWVVEEVSISDPMVEKIKYIYKDIILKTISTKGLVGTTPLTPDKIELVSHPTGSGNTQVIENSTSKFTSRSYGDGGASSSDELSIAPSLLSDLTTAWGAQPSIQTVHDAAMKIWKMLVETRSLLYTETTSEADDSLTTATDEEEEDTDEEITPMPSLELEPVVISNKPLDPVTSISSGSSQPVLSASPLMPSSPSADPVRMTAASRFVTPSPSQPVERPRPAASTSIRPPYEMSVDDWIGYLDQRDEGRCSCFVKGTCSHKENKQCKEIETQFKRLGGASVSTTSSSDQKEMKDAFKRWAQCMYDVCSQYHRDLGEELKIDQIKSFINDKMIVIAGRRRNKETESRLTTCPERYNKLIKSILCDIV